MKVKKLIELLSKANQDATVMVIDNNPDYDGVEVTLDSVKDSLKYGGDYFHILVKITEQDREV